MIALLPHEVAEWSRCAKALYARGMNDGAHIVSAAAALRVLPIAQYDRAASIYRAWLVFDEPKGKA